MEAALTESGATVARRAEVDSVLDRVRSWAGGRPDVRGVAMVGSWTRGPARMDSDVDIVVLCDDPNAFVESAAWVADAIGAANMPAPVVRTTRWGPLLTERRVRLASGLEIEFDFALPAWAAVDPLDDGTARVVGDGCVVLHDPVGTFAELQRVIDGARRHDRSGRRHPRSE